MPQFEPGVLKTAVATITVQPTGLSSEAELFLGPNEFTPVATSGKVAFISTGSQQQVRLPVIMPSAPGIYHVYLDLSTGGMIIASYIAVQDVEVIPAIQYIRIDWFDETWEEGVGAIYTPHPLYIPFQAGANYYDWQVTVPAIPGARAEEVEIILVKDGLEIRFGGLGFSGDPGTLLRYGSGIMPQPGYYQVFARFRDANNVPIALFQADNIMVI